MRWAFQGHSDGATPISPLQTSEAMNEKKKDNRGGKREGAGRKPKPIMTANEQKIERMERSAAKLEKETGVSIDDVLVRSIYAASSSTREKLTAIRIYKEYTMIKTTENNVSVTDQQIGPVIGLPELKPLPLNVVPINNK